MNENPANADAEIEAMSKIANALTNLDQDAIARILTWACQRYSVSVKQANNPRNSAAVESGNDDMPNQSFADLAELYTKASPRTDAEKALVVGYWHQKVLGEVDFDTQTINTELKNLGYGVTNITRAFDTLRDTRPSLAIQLKKGGTSKQARKRIKITLEGLRTVERILNRIANSEE